MAENKDQKGFDVLGAFANVSLALVDVQRDVSQLKKQMNDVLQGFVQIQQAIQAKFQSVDAEIAALKPAEVKQAEPEAVKAE